MQRGKKRKKSISFSMKYSRGDVVLTHRKKFTEILIDKGLPRGEPGQPDIPWQKVFVSVPWNADDIEIHIDNVRTVTLAEKLIIAPLQHNVPYCFGTYIQSVEPDKALYSSNKTWPEHPVRFVALRQTRGCTIAEIEVCPFYYHFREGKLELIQTMDLALLYNETKARPEIMDLIVSERYKHKDIDHVRKLVINPDDVFIPIAPPPAREPSQPYYPEVHYVIVTSRDLAQKFQNLADWRTKFGQNAKVVCWEDILANTVPDTKGAEFNYTSGYIDRNNTSEGTRDVQEAIRNFLKWAHVSWGTEYVLIGGDVGIIPIRQAIHHRLGRYFDKKGDWGDPNTLVEYSIDDVDWNSYNGSGLGYNPTPLSLKPGLDKDQVLHHPMPPGQPWECNPSDKTPSICVQVAAGTPINHVVLTWGTPAKSFTIQITIQKDPQLWKDDTSWLDITPTLSGSTGKQSIQFATICAEWVRLKISDTSNKDFSLLAMDIFGIPGGAAYRWRNTKTVTRVILSGAGPNLSNDIDDNLIIVSGGPHEGELIPYNGASDDSSYQSSAGWHFIKDFLGSLEDPSNISPAPTTYLEIRGPETYHGYSFLIKYSDNNIPTDLYYTDIDYPLHPTGNLTHDWDGNNNLVYGENYHGTPPDSSLIAGEPDKLNLIPVLYIGRASVSTADDVDTFVNKVIQYEKFVYQKGSEEHPLPDNFALSVFLGERQIGTTYAETLRTKMLQIKSTWHFMCRYDDAAGIGSRSDLAPAKSSHDIIQGLERDVGGISNIGNNAVALTSHGGFSEIGFINRTDVRGLRNCPGIWFGFACFTNQLDLPRPDEAISEVAMRNPEGGSVAYVGNTRFGWPRQDGDTLYTFFTEMCNSGILGQMFQAQQIQNDYMSQLNLNLLGDPAMRVWSDIPKKLLVHHRHKIFAGVQVFKVTITSGGNPVTPATDPTVGVCLTMPGVIYKAQPDYSGVAEIPIELYYGGTMYVTVSGKNLIPYIGTVTVIQPSIGKKQYPKYPKPKKPR
jgi:hypothetical protein